MKVKRIVLMFAAALAALSVVGFAAAQPPRNTDGEAGRGRRPHPVANGIQAVLDSVADATGLEKSAIVEQLSGGKTLAEVVSENGGAVEAVKADLAAQLTERLDTAVENGRITQERADEILTSTAARLDDLFDHVFKRLPLREFPGGRRGQPPASNEI